MKKRFISFVLAIVVLIPLFPQGVLARSLVKSIDVYEGNFSLSLEGNKFSHKEVFLYEGDIYLPMTDLAKALGMGTSFNPNNRTIVLNSNGKLSFSDNTKYPIAYQRGYEIDAKLRVMDGINKEINDFLNNSNKKTNSQSVDLKNISVGFSGISVLLDGNKIQVQGEPFVYKNDVYLPLTGLSPFLYITPKLNKSTIDLDANGVLLDKIKNSAMEYYSIEELAQFRDDLNNRYARELEELVKKKSILMDVKIPYEKIESLSQMEKYLNKHLGEIKDLDIDISLKSGTGNWYYIDIDFPTRYSYRWRQLSRRDVESHIWDIYVAISSLYDEEAKLQGNIMKYVSFDTKGKNLVFSFLNSGLDMTTKVDPVFLQELLEKYYDRYRSIYFDYSVRISGYDLEIEIVPSSSHFMDRWSPSEKLDFLERINNEIKRYYPGVKVNGKIVYKDYEPIAFIIEDNKVRSPQLMMDSSDFLKDKFGVLNTNGVRIPMKYGLHQVDKDNFKLMVDMDFSIYDPKWTQKSYDDLANLMHEVIKSILDIWDANIFVQVFDKNQALAYEFVISQDTVQMVQASPGGGDIVEGSTIALSTGTTGATIYYTTDGSIPNENSTIYKNPIIATKIVRAYAVKEGFKDSPVATFEYNLIADGDAAEGLDDLTFVPGTLNKRFDKKIQDYILTVPFGTEKVTVTPTVSKGSIKVNDKDVSTDGDVVVDVVDNSIIKISHSETGKNKDRVYEITVKMGKEVESNVKLESYEFNTTIIGIFSGRVSGDYSGHEIRLVYDSTNNVYKKVPINSDGSFEITDFDISSFTKDYIGYRYEILDPNNNIVDKGKIIK